MNLTEYEVYVEDGNPCGGSEYAQKTFLEIETDSPVDYVKAHGKYPILQTGESPDGDLVILTGNGKGYFTKYVFTK